MKKIISIMSAVLVAFSMFNVTAADNDSKDYYIDGEQFEQHGDFAYYPNTNQIYAYIGDTKNDVVIPEGSDITRMKTIGGKFHVKSLTISNNVKFEHISLQADTIILKDGIKDIPDKAFENSEATKVVFPQTLESIGNHAFDKSDLSGDLVLPNSLRIIGKEAFKGTDISSVKMSDSVTYIDDLAFGDCLSLTEVHLSNNLTQFGDNILRSAPLKKLNIPDKWDVTKNDCGSFGVFARNIEVDYEINREMTVELWDKLPKYDSLKRYCSSDKLKNYADGDDWWVIGDVLVKYTGISQKPVIPDFIKEVHYHAFGQSDLKPHETIIIPSSVKKLDRNCFVQFFMDYLVIPDTVEEIGDSFVANTQLLELTINGNPKLSADALKDANFLLKSKLHIDTNCKLPTNFNTEDLATEEWWLNDPAYIANRTENAVATIAPTATPKPTETAEPTPTATPTPTVTPIKENEKLTVTSDNNNINISVNNENVIFPDAQPFVDNNNRTQVPIRAVSEMLDCKVDWNGDNKTVTITRENGEIVKLVLDSDIMTVGSKPVQMDTAAIIKDDRTYIPVRFVAEALGLTVEWIE